MVQFTITENEGNQRLDRFMKKYLKSAPLSYIYKLIRKDIKVNGKRSQVDTVLHSGDEITLYIDDSEIEKYTKRKLNKKAKRQFSVAYEDDNVIIVEKPAGLLTHGDRTEKKNTLVNQVLGYLMDTGEYEPSKEKTFIPAPVNRLDRNTSGLIIFGKNSKALQGLGKMFRNKTDIEKYYLTIVHGEIKKPFILRDRMVKDEKTNTVQVLKNSDEGKDMETVVTPIEVSNGYTLAEIQLITGRTHQIRAHLASKKYPIIGDAKYGDAHINRKVERQFDLTTQFLHSYRLKFIVCDENLKSLEGLEVRASLPPKLEEIKREIFGS